MSIRITVNGESRLVDASPDTPLLYVLRNDFLKSRLGKHGMMSEMEIWAALPRSPVGKLSKKGVVR
jgi:hypothetical protein